MNEDDPYDIQVHNKHADDGVDPSVLQEGVRETLRRFGTASAEVSVAVVGDTEIAQLHEKYMNIKGPTDVLTFDFAEKRRTGANGRHVEGEIVVSADTAKRRAEERTHSVAAELALYVVHGTLHLLGMDDASEQQAMKMHDMEDEILATIGVGRIFGG